MVHLMPEHPWADLKQANRKLAANRKFGKLLSGEYRSPVINSAPSGKRQKHAVLEPLTKVIEESKKYITFHIHKSIYKILPSGFVE